MVATNEVLSKRWLNVTIRMGYEGRRSQRIAAKKEAEKGNLKYNHTWEGQIPGRLWPNVARWIKL